MNSSCVPLGKSPEMNSDPNREVGWKQGLRGILDLIQGPPPRFADPLEAMDVLDLRTKNLGAWLDQKERLRLRDPSIRKHEVGVSGPQIRQLQIRGAQFFSRLSTRGLLKGLSRLEATTWCCPELPAVPVVVSKQKHPPVGVEHNESCR